VARSSARAVTLTEALLVLLAIVVVVGLVILVLRQQIERGRAAYTAEGTTGTLPTGTVDYADYATADRTGLIAFERWAPAQSWEVSTGRAVSRGELAVYHRTPEA
jgi:uncharacterized membrane protein